MSKELPGMSTMSLKMDILRFQDEILREMRQMQAKLDAKYIKTEENLNQTLTKSDLKVKSLEKKIAELVNLISVDNTMKEKIESIINFKEEMQDIIFKRKAKFAEFEKKVNNDIDNFNKILSDSVLYPSLIGKKAKFQTFHEYIDYTMQELAQLNLYKNKNEIDSITGLKKKIDGAIEAFKMQLNNIPPKEVVKKMLNDLEEKMNSNFKIYDDKLKDTRVENYNYSLDIHKKAEEMDRQIDKLMTAHNYINMKLEKFENSEAFSILGNEIMAVNVKINKIIDVIRDLVAFHPDVRKNFPKEFEKKPQNKIISGVRQYIKGNLNAEELSTMKTFTFQKMKSKNYGQTVSTPKKAPNPQQENINPLPKRASIFIDSRSLNKVEEKTDFVNKKFLSKKSVNLSKQENIITNKLSETDTFKRGTLLRKKTFSVGIKPSFESSKINNHVNKINYNDEFLKGQSQEKTNNIIEEENETNNISNNSNNENKDENKYQPSLENENNRSATKKRVKHVTIREIVNENNSPKKENIINLKNQKKEENSKEENVKDNNKNINEKEKIDNINKVNNDKKDINQDSENKKNSLINLNKIDLNKKEIKFVESKNIENNKYNILDVPEQKNSHGRNKKVSILKKDSNKNVFPDEKNNISKKLLKKSNQKITLNLQNSFNSDSVSLKSEEKNNNNLNTLSDKNKILIPINYDYKPMNPNINIVSIKKKLYNTYSNFPKINRDLSDNQNNNISNPIGRDKFTKTIFDDNYYKKITYPGSSFKQTKKILLMNPDNLPINYFDKAYKDILKNNLNNNLSERNFQNNKDKNGIKFQYKNKNIIINSFDDGKS